MGRLGGNNLPVSHVARTRHNHTHYLILFLSPSLLDTGWLLTDSEIVQWAAREICIGQQFALIEASYVTMRWFDKMENIGERCHNKAQFDINQTVLQMESRSGCMLRELRQMQRYNWRGLQVEELEVFVETGHS